MRREKKEKSFVYNIERRTGPSISFTVQEGLVVHGDSILLQAGSANRGRCRGRSRDDTATDTHHTRRPQLEDIVYVHSYIYTSIHPYSTDSIDTYYHLLCVRYRRHCPDEVSGTCPVTNSSSQPGLLAADIYTRYPYAASLTH